MCLLCIKGYATEDGDEWGGLWNRNQETNSITQEIPFWSEFYDDVVVIHNENPDRDIHCEVINQGNIVVKSYDIPQEDAVLISIPIDDLSDNTSYTIVLTSSNPLDRVYTSFVK